MEEPAPEAVAIGEDCPICMAPMGQDQSEAEQIGRLKCSHSYHNQCLLEWSETSNTCPYCRAEYHEVEILQTPDGSVLRSYKVDPVQIPAVVEDEEALFDEEDIYFSSEEESEPEAQIAEIMRCVVCGSQDQEQVLMLCDACDDCYHSFCLGLDELPCGSFNCPTCLTVGSRAPIDSDSVIRTVESVRALRSSRTLRRSSRRARDTRPRQAQHQNTTRQRQLRTWTRAWERVRQRTWSRLNAELEYVMPVDSVLSANQEEELRAWRARVERRGGPNSRMIIPTTSEQLNDPRTTALWKAFDRASEALNGNRPSSRNSGTSKSTSSLPDSPIDPPQQESYSDAGLSVQRKQKRPNARVTANAGSSGTPSSKRSRSPELSLPRKRTMPQQSTSQAPSFLTALLNNIKAPPKCDGRPIQLIDHNNKRQRPRSPVSHPLSPMSLSSTSASCSSSASNTPQMEPVSPPWSPIEPLDLSSKGKRRDTEVTQPQGHKNTSVEPSSRRPTKALISSLVSKHLKPHYKTTLDKATFTILNRNITRTLFESFTTPLLTTTNELLDKEVRVLVAKALEPQHVRSGLSVSDSSAFSPP